MSMSVNKSGIILFSSFLIFATAPLAPAQSTQDQTQDQTKKQAKKGKAKKETGRTADQNNPTEENKAGTTQKTETGKTGAKKAKKTSSISKDKIRDAQMALMNEGFDPGPVDGVMGPMTMTALRNYQSHNQLEVTGTLTPETQNALLHGATAGTTRSNDFENQQQPYDTQQTQSSADASLGVSPEPTASSVDDVRQVQVALIDLMYSPGDMNGIMTADTQQAVREFQWLNDLPVTGIVDEQTKSALDTQWRSGVESSQLGQTPLTGEREKPLIGGQEQQNQTDTYNTYNQNRTDTDRQNRSETYNQNQTRSDTYNQNQSDTYNQNRSDTAQDRQDTYSRDNSYKQDQTDRGTSPVHNQDATTDHDRYHKDHDGKNRDHASGKYDKEGAERAQKAAAVLQDLTTSTDKRIPNELLEHAEAIAVIPHMIKGALGIGGRYGKGLVSQRLSNGRWSPAAFMEIGGGSFGAQIGATSTDVVLVFTDRNALETLEGGKDLKLGVDAGITAGPIGREGEAGVNAKLDSAIYAYSRSKGLFAGIALDGAVLSMDNDMDHKVYGQSVDAREILNGNVGMNSTVQPFMNALEKVVPKKRISQK
jgi:lipid-binding SYLF domain-containing protein/peptidoglycan hydrolase-like protein with peptidoglycan-binding domain